MKIFPSRWLDLVVIVFALLYCVFSFRNCLLSFRYLKVLFSQFLCRHYGLQCYLFFCVVEKIRAEEARSCAFHPLVASETTSLNITGAKVVDGRWADDARVMSTMPAADTFRLETASMAAVDQAESKMCKADCGIEHQCLCSEPGQQCVHRTPERCSVAVEDPLTENDLVTTICTEPDQAGHPDPQAAVCQVNTEQNDGDVEPRRVLFDTIEPTQTCSRQQIVKSWCTCWGLAQMLVGVGFILFPYIRMSEHDHFAHDHLSPSNPKYLQWLLQSRSRS
ncbi:unnamed protein product [Sphagnum jensenii]|uniref:Uncharacterized protein n=1 Tax=Sphagnum jensenii TaxID=128206 RepID=A0ABP1ASU9_9BRYO